MALTNENRPSGNVQSNLPLEPLFTLLHNNGFQVKPDDYVEMLKVTERFGSRDIDETAKWICPIVATSENEQVKFYNLIKEYKKLYREEEVKKIPKVHLWQKIAFPSIVAAILWYLLRTVLAPDPFPLVDGNQRYSARMGDTVRLTSKYLFESREKDTSKIKIKWKFSNGEVNQGLEAPHVFTSIGENIVIREYSSSEIPLTRTSDTVFVFVCQDIPRDLSFVPSIAPIFKDSIVNFKININAPEGLVTSYRWNFEDTTITTSGPELKNYSFDQEGSFDVTCTAIVGEPGSPCSVSATQTIAVVENGNNYESSFSHFNSKIMGGQTRLKWWVHAGFLIPAAIGIFYSLFKKNRKKPLATKSDTIEKQKTTKQVYDIPFERNDLRIIQPERDLRMMLLQLRMKAEEENLVLNVLDTINSIIRAGGSPQLVYSPQVRQQEYLVLIDRANPRSMITHLFEYMVGTMTESGIPLTSYYYDKDFLCSNRQHPFGISLKRLAEIHSKSTLLILGKAYELVYRAYPIIEDKFLVDLERWEYKAIITPLPVLDWGSKEKVLQEEMILLPADILSLQKLVPALKEKVKLKLNQIKNIESNPYSMRYVDFRDPDALMKYLDNDEILFQWICAACVYPRLRWEVLIEVGKAILDKYGRPEKMNYTTLFKIARISWMQEGVFPQSTRLELLKRLSVENEMVAREVLQQMLVNVSILYKGNNYVFEEERRRQQLTNEFVLFSNNREAYPKFAGSEEAFKKIWGDDTILDVPMRKYLERPAGSEYETPVQMKHQSVGVPEFFSMEDKKEKTPLITKRIGSAFIALLLIVLWIYLGEWGGALRVQGMELYEFNTSQTVRFDMDVTKDFIQCGDSTGKYFDNLYASLLINNVSYAAKYDAQNGLVSFNIPYKDYHGGEGELAMNWGRNVKELRRRLDFSADSVPGGMVIKCLNYIPPKVNAGVTASTKWAPISVRSLPASLREIWKGQTANRLAFIDLSRQRIYYSTNGKNTYGNYSIDSVYSNDSGSYKVITVGDKNQFRIFFLQNISSSSFDISVCPMVTVRQELNNPNLYCGSYERMSLYYENNQQNVYLPMVPGQLVASERRKVAGMANTIKKGGNDLLYNINLNQNTQFAAGVDVKSMIRPALENNGFNYPRQAPNEIITIDIKSPTPFSRSYLEFKANYPLGNETQNQNPNQQQQQESKSDTGSNTQDQKTPIGLDSVNIQGYSSNAFREARIINFTKPGNLSRQDIIYINSLGKVLSENPNAKIRLVAYYGVPEERRIATDNVAAIKKNLITGKMVVAPLQVLEQYVDESQQKKGASASLPNFIFTTALGTGFEEYGGTSWRVVIFINSFPASFGVTNKKTN